MKKIILATAVMLSVKAYSACPSLAGDWICGEENSTSEMSIEQSSIPNGTKYILNDDQGQTIWLVDGVARPYQNADFTGKITGQCSADAKVLSLVTDLVSYEGDVKIVENQQMTLDSADQFTVNRDRHITFVGEDPRDYAYSFVCKRK